MQLAQGAMHIVTAGTPQQSHMLHTFKVAVRPHAHASCEGALWVRSTDLGENQAQHV